MTEDEVLEALREVYDPELGVNVVDLGLVYGVEIGERTLRVAMTMTTRACPLADHVRDSATALLRERYPELVQVEVELVWSPAWNRSMISEAGRQALGWAD